ncbi:hypothetical protein HJFPF1_01201 [Paramyrothecium foliicola]|nr:hypothetical protein HJFPF1_01201 [Paramyrothecium foliicola]
MSDTASVLAPDAPSPFPQDRVLGLILVNCPTLAYEVPNCRDQSSGACEIAMQNLVAQFVSSQGDE